MFLTVLYLFLLLFGLFLLLKSSEYFVDHAVRFSEIVGISRWFLSLFVISISTSLPEFFISFLSALQGEYSIALGNVFGTVITNIGLGIGLPFIFMFGRNIDKRSENSCIAMILAATIALVLALDGVYFLFDGIVFLLFMVGYFLYEKEREKGKEIIKKEGDPKKEFAIMVISLLGMYLFSRAVILSIIKISELLNISKHFISISIVAIGTSLPEIVTSFTAAVKKEFDISVGTIVGSNIIDICMILGFSSIFSKIMVDRVIFWDIGFFFFISIVLFAFTRKRFFGRKEAVVLSTLSILYILISFFIGNAC